MTAAHRHRDATHFYYETVSKPFLGPRVRAKAALSKVTTKPLPEQGFLDYLKHHHRDVYSSLEWVRFHQFYWQEDLVIYRIAILSVAPDPIVRDQAFHERESITIGTGWYPLVQGSRADFYHLPFEKQLSIRALFDPAHSLLPIGALRSLVPQCHSTETGNSFVLEGSKGKLLLDFGMGAPTNDTGSHIARFLSHYHRDHSGGIWDHLDIEDSPVLLSRVSLTYLCTLPHVPAILKRRLVRYATCAESVRSLRTEDGGELSLFPVFHAPGSLGLTVHDANASFTYFGDLCLENGFYSAFKLALSQVPQRDTGKRWVLLDAATVGRSDAAIETEDTPARILRELTTIARRRNVIFVSNQPEGLLYTYIRAFALTTSRTESPVRIFISQDLYTVLRAFWRPVILRRFEDQDPFVSKLLGKGMMNFAESHRLYPLQQTALSRVPLGEACIAFCSLSDVTGLEAVRQRIRNADVILMGTMALRDDIPAELLQARPRSILRVASPDWSFHSDDNSVAEFVRALTAQKVRVLLFHNFAKRLEKFRAKYGLDPDLVQIVRQAPISLQD